MTHFAVAHSAVFRCEGIHEPVPIVVLNAATPVAIQIAMGEVPNAALIVARVVALAVATPNVARSAVHRCATVEFPNEEVRRVVRVVVLDAELPFAVFRFAETRYPESQCAVFRYVESPCAVNPNAMDDRPNEVRPNGGRDVAPVGHQNLNAVQNVAGFAPAPMVFLCAAPVPAQLRVVQCAAPRRD